MGLRREKMYCECGREATVVLDKQITSEGPDGSTIYHDKYQIVGIWCQEHARQLHDEGLARRAQGRPVASILFYGLEGQK